MGFRVIRCFLWIIIHYKVSLFDRLESYLQPTDKFRYIKYIYLKYIAYGRLFGTRFLHSNGLYLA